MIVLTDFFQSPRWRPFEKCNGTKEKGVPAISLLRYKLGNVFSNRSMYMQMRTGSFKEDFSKNAVYRFLNSAKTNWLRFTTALASTIINDEVKELTDEKRSNVFILDDTLFNRTSAREPSLVPKFLTIPTCDTKRLSPSNTRME